MMSGATGFFGGYCYSIMSELLVIAILIKP